LRFRYLRDPLFLACAAAYLVNRVILRRVWEGGFVHDHLNDLICLPVWVPVMLWVERRLGLRRHDGPPEALEVIIPLLAWSWLFEIALPKTEFFGRYCVADHRDILYYAAGALGAVFFWRS